jgi:hypothetical protein
MEHGILNIFCVNYMDLSTFMGGLRLGVHRPTRPMAVIK